MSGTDAFNPTVYDAIRDGAQKSANVVAPLVFDVAMPSTVIDVGCGEGWWALAFDALGCRTIGLDGAHVETVGCSFRPTDLLQPIPVAEVCGLMKVEKFDLAVCLEVGEHLPESRAAGLVADLCELSDVILFSAAIPHQTGPGHITCRWPSWWAHHFADHGFYLDGSLRWAIWNDARVEPWYRQNLMIATRDPRSVSEPLDVVHPEIHGWGR